MGRINFKRAYLAGLAAASAGAAVCVFAFILAYQLEAYNTIRAILSDPSLRVPVLLVHMFIGGPCGVWFYATLKTRLGARTKTALIWATLLWLVVVPYEWAVMSSIGVLTPIRFASLAAICAVSWVFMLAMMLIGAHYYDEGQKLATVEAHADVG
jgi:hypothetical protein